MCDNKGGFFLFCRQIGRCKATAGEERGVCCLFSLQLSCFCFVIVFFYRLLICFPLYLAFLSVFVTCYKTSEYPVVRQISNLFRIMKSVVWRQKSNMIKKQDSSFSHKGDFFSHRTHRSNRTHLRTVLNSQKAFGIQISQSVSAKGGCKVL